MTMQDIETSIKEIWALFKETDASFKKTDALLTQKLQETDKRIKFSLAIHRPVGKID